MDLEVLWKNSYLCLSPQSTHPTILPDFDSQEESCCWLSWEGREEAHESSSPIDPSARSPPPPPMPSRPSSTPRKWRGFLVQHGKGCTNAESYGGSNPWFQRMFMEFERNWPHSCSTQNVLNLIITEVSRSRNNLPVLLSYLHAARNYLPSLRLGLHNNDWVVFWA